MKNEKLRAERVNQQLSQELLANLAGVSRASIERAENGAMPRSDTINRICHALNKSPEDLGFVTFSRREVNTKIATGVLGGLLLLSSLSSSAVPKTLEHFWGNDSLAQYAKSIIACQNIYFAGRPQEVEDLLPILITHTTHLASVEGPQQTSAGQLASLALQLASEIATDRENFGQGEHLARQAYDFAELAADPNLQVSSLIALANIGFHRKRSTAALHAYQQAVSLFSDERITALSKGRAYAGLAEVQAMRGNLQEAMRAKGMAYDCYPEVPENDPAYQHLRSSHYALYVFADLQTHLFLGQPKEAKLALIQLQKTNKDSEKEPITKLDLLYYQAEIDVAQNNIESGTRILEEAATLARKLGSRLYFNKLTTSYEQTLSKWPHETMITNLADIFHWNEISHIHRYTP
ncbi:hypothetical protein KDA_30450 [Dictyobacter alpinus]|uniref:HTH cro/C1-type domain-containing protein n=1 Tax=Dictyobacter alpinus TaxID=2014873 RepID=A0A402B858_9CHLR|nr:helix-turn-helix transcriptional regulator [Dictyobacter alpinus]GCE27561.1 hypothetical protein KDA_30450 [Dictyobacter alpinus]